jgi:hypothetical protein
MHTWWSVMDDLIVLEKYAADIRVTWVGFACLEIVYAYKWVDEATRTRKSDIWRYLTHHCSCISGSSSLQFEKLIAPSYFLILHHQQQWQQPSTWTLEHDDDNFHSFKHVVWIWLAFHPPTIWIGNNWGCKKWTNCNPYLIASSSCSCSHTHFKFQVLCCNFYTQIRTHWTPKEGLFQKWLQQWMRSRTWLAMQTSGSMTSEDCECHVTWVRDKCGGERSGRVLPTSWLGLTFPFKSIQQSEKWNSQLTFEILSKHKCLLKDGFVCWFSMCLSAVSERLLYRQQQRQAHFVLLVLHHDKKDRT